MSFGVILLNGKVIQGVHYDSKNGRPSLKFLVQSNIRQVEEGVVQGYFKEHGEITLINCISTSWSQSKGLYEIEIKADYAIRGACLTSNDLYFQKYSIESTPVLEWIKAHVVHRVDFPAIVITQFRFSLTPQNQLINI